MRFSPKGRNYRRALLLPRDGARPRLDDDERVRARAACGHPGSPNPPPRQPRQPAACCMRSWKAHREIRYGRDETEPMREPLDVVEGVAKSRIRDRDPINRPPLRRRPLAGWLRAAAAAAAAALAAGWLAAGCWLLAAGCRLPAAVCCLLPAVAAARMDGDSTSGSPKSPHSSQEKTPTPHGHHD